MVYHTHDSRKSEAGFPDLVMVRNEHIWFVELKSEKGKLTSAQKTWLAAICDTTTANQHVHYDVWRPEHWIGGTIESILK